GGTDAGIDRYLDRRIAVPHQRLDIAGDGDGAPGIPDQLPLGVIERAAVDVGGIGPQRLLRIQFLEQRIATKLADADVDRDARTDVAGGLERFQDQLGGDGWGSHVKGEQLILAREILLAQARDILWKLVS